MKLLAAWTLLLAAAGVAVIVATVDDYGATWDEPTQARLGEDVLDGLRTGSERWRREGGEPVLAVQRYYGPAFEVLAAWLYAERPEARVRVRHALIAATGLVAVLALVPLGLRVGGPWAALFAPVLLVMLPRFYGHAFTNSKDLPFAVFFTLALYALVRFVERGAPVWAVTLGLASGAALAVRPGGLPMLFLLVAFALFVPGHAKDRFPRLAGGALGAGALAWAIMIALWPHAHEAPLLHPLRAVQEASSFSMATPVFFDGRTVPSHELPWSYLPRFLVLTTPPVVGLLAGLGAFALVRDGVRRPTDPGVLPGQLVVLWVAGPLAAAVLLDANLYDGLRHVLFVLPAVALLGAVGAARGLGRVPARARAAVAAGLLVLCALPAASLVRLHPYQATYFNVLAGGVAGAQDRYETDYWVASYREAARWVDEQVRASGRDGARVLVAGNSFSLPCAAWFLAPSIEAAAIFEPASHGPLPPGVDYYIATTRWGLDRGFPEAPVVHRVERDGAVFTVVRGR